MMMVATLAAAFGAWAAKETVGDYTWTHPRPCLLRGGFGIIQVFG